MRRLALASLFWLLAGVAGAAPVWEAPQPSPAALRAAAEDVRAEAKATERKPVAEALAKRAGMLEDLATALDERSRRVSEDKAARSQNEQEIKEVAAAERAPPVTPEAPTAEGLRQLEGEVEAGRRTVETLAGERSTLETRMEALPRLLEEARLRAQGARTRAAALEEERANAADLEERALAGVRAENARLEARVAEEEVMALAAEGAGRGGLELLDARLDIAERRQRLRSARLTSYREALEQQLTDDLTRLRTALADAQQARREAVDAVGIFKATQQLRIAQLALDVAEIDRRRLDLERALAVQRERLAVERNELEGVRTAVERDPRSSYTATRLKQTFQRLQRRQQGLEQDAAPGLADVGEARAQRLDVGDALAAFSEQWRDQIAALPDDAQLSPADRRAALDKLREGVRQELRRQSASLTAYIAAGEALRSVQAERVEVFADLDRLVRTRIFWIQDAAPLWIDLGNQVGPELSRLADWSIRLQDDTTAAALGALAEDPLELALALLVLVVLPTALLLTRRRLGRLVHREARTRGGQVRRVLMGVLLSSLGPLTLLLAELIVGRTGLPDDIRQTLQALLEHAAVAAWAWSLTQLFLGRDGVLVEHFGVAADRTQEAAGVLSLLVTGYAVCLLPERLLSGAPVRGVTLARVGWIALGVVSLLAAARALRRKGPLMAALARAFGDRPDRASLAPPFRALVLLTIIAIIGMDVAGYRYGAGRLARGMVLSLLVVVPLALTRIMVTEAWRRSRVTEETPSPRAPRWIRPVFVSVGALLLALVWGVDQGAVRLLDAIHLYAFSDGTHVSLLDLVGALVALAIAIWLVRGLPNLMKIIVFPYFSLDDGVQYAITTIARYLLFFVGLFAAFAALHLDLGKLSWLMAALGVGIGFGLQEIVSNFISGVILLVERPIRVGDFVSVGPLEGRVLHINIRATALLSLDRREIIVPNKDLITKEVTNWTRGDRMIRITVPISVAYGSNVEQVTSVLLQVAGADPVVLVAPAPEVIFSRHGDSSLDFELRVHLPDPWVRFQTIHRLNGAINRAFAEHGVQIPFPQRDLHIRTISADLKLPPAAPPPAAPPPPAEQAPPAPPPDQPPP
ncbi:MAG: mechanosensitive ion channel [Myxococcales bacterium]|nr:mechanosensitive ion channel [Myxococcales bacterium]